MAALKRGQVFQHLYAVNGRNGTEPRCVYVLKPNGMGGKPLVVSCKPDGGGIGKGAKIRFISREHLDSMYFKVRDPL